MDGGDAAASADAAPGPAETLTARDDGGPWKLDAEVVATAHERANTVTGVAVQDAEVRKRCLALCWCVHWHPRYHVRSRAG